MAIIRILQYPQDSKLLARKGKKVTKFDDDFSNIVADMFQTLYSAKNCAALAATQLDIPDAPHVTVIDFSPQKDQPLCLVNAEIVHRDGETNLKEGCMSVNSIKGNSISAVVKRAEKIKVIAQDQYGKKIELEEDGFMAKCIQHELDHLDGKLFIDYFTGLKRKMLERKILS